ncbi:MAG: hypothetical protein OEW24_09380 [Chloroflexota bacterium]|nr:hypothetical protein [Chloroflexota bacterium]
MPIELSADARMARRVTRLAFVSLEAPGLILLVAIRTLDAPTWVLAALAAGWVLMPTVLFVSLARPRLRYALVLPAALISVGLLVICAWWLPAEPLAAAGWWLMTSGIGLGGGLGLWFWYRLVPVPAWLDDLNSAGRWGLIGLHVGLVAVGWGLAMTG